MSYIAVETLEPPVPVKVTSMLQHQPKIQSSAHAAVIQVVMQETRENPECTLCVRKKKSCNR